MIFSFEAGIHHVFECLGRMVSRVAGIVIIEHLDVIDYVQTYHIHEREWAPGGLIEYHPGPVNVSVVNKTVGPHVQGFFLYGPPDPVETESQELFINLQGDHAKGGYEIVSRLKDLGCGLATAILSRVDRSALTHLSTFAIFQQFNIYFY